MARRADKRQRVFIEDMETLSKHWQEADPATFGLSDEQAQGLIDRYQAAAESLRKAERARAVARAHLIENRTAIGALRKEFGALSEIIDGVARSTGDPGVYARARIAPPGKRAPLPAPPAPIDLEHELHNDGSIAVKFTIDDGGRGGLVYEVQRQLEPIEGEPGPFEPFGVVTSKRFIDDGVPEGLRAVRYRARAIRSSGARSGWSVPMAVFFGTQKRSTNAVAGRIRGGGEQSGQDQFGQGHSGNDQAGKDQSGKDQSGRGRGAG